MTWYHIQHIEDFDSPMLLVFPARIRENIRRMIQMAGSAKRLWPHVKTHKMTEVVQLQMDQGIQQFKCATIAEAEMLGRAGVKKALLAYQPVGPKVQRLLNLVKAFPQTRFSALVDHPEAATRLAEAFDNQNLDIEVWIDLDLGMHRTGISPSEAASLFGLCRQLKGIQPVGLHAYDGHLHQTDLVVRASHSDACYQPVQQLADTIQQKWGSRPAIIAGGSPTFPIHAKREEVNCSPGTCLLWDWGYRQMLPDQEFLLAALIACRVISKTGKHRICVDLGHKSVAAEQPFPRVHFLNLPNARPISQSEEHLVLEVDDNLQYPIGMVLYGSPIHICPTCALYDQAHVVENGLITQKWKIVARARQITI